jgi:hypothetical protein
MKKNKNHVLQNNRMLMIKMNQIISLKPNPKTYKNAKPFHNWMISNEFIYTYIKKFLFYLKKKIYQLFSQNDIIEVGFYRKAHQDGITWIEVCNE